MIQVLYSIFDIDANEFGPIFSAKNSKIAYRYVNEMSRGIGSSNLVSFALYKMGEFDIEKGIVDTTVSLVDNISNIVSRETIEVEEV